MIVYDLQSEHMNLLISLEENYTVKAFGEISKELITKKFNICTYNIK